MCVCVVEFVVVVWPRCSCTALHGSGGTANWRASLRTSNIQQARLQPCGCQEGSRCVVAGHTARDSVRRCLLYRALQGEVLMQTTLLPHVCSDTRGGPMLSTWPRLRTALAPTQATSHTRARRMAWYEQCVRVCVRERGARYHTLPRTSLTPHARPVGLSMQGIGNHNCVYWNAWDMKDVSPALCLRDTVGNLYSGYSHGTMHVLHAALHMQCITSIRTALPPSHPPALLALSQVCLLGTNEWCPVPLGVPATIRRR